MTAMSYQSTAVAIPLAVGAAASFAVANVAQMRASRRAEAPEGVSAKLLIRLIRDKEWLLGLATSILGYGCQAVSLYLAPVLLVQPLIVSELLFALPLSARLAGVQLHKREWTGAALVAVGIAVFVAVGHPKGDRTTIDTSTWVTITISVAVAVGVLVVVAESRRRQPMLRASLLALAASFCFGLLAVLTKVVGHEFTAHGLGTLVRPQPYMLVAAAILGLLLSQTAFRIAPLSVSLPIIDVGEPVSASLLAGLAFGETIGIGIGSLVGVAVAGAAALTGIALLDTSAVVRAAQADLDEAARQRASVST
jgi:drug/metabolite transporter (DMT)-like permease